MIIFKTISKIMLQDQATLIITGDTKGRISGEQIQGQNNIINSSSNSFDLQDNSGRQSQQASRLSALARSPQNQSQNNTNNDNNQGGRVEQRARQDPRHFSLINAFLEYFDPILAFICLSLTFFLEVTIVASTSRGDIIATCIIGVFACVLIYVSILLSYSIFKKMFIKSKMTSLLLCCTLARKCRRRQLKYRYKYITLIMNVGIAITISVLTANQISKLKEDEKYGNYDQDKKAENQAIIKLIVMHCISYWLLSLFEVTIGCFKLALLLALGIIFWPCLLIYYQKYGKFYMMDMRRNRRERERRRRERSNRNGAAGDDNTDDEAGDPNNPRVGGRNADRLQIKNLNKADMKKFLQTVFFRKKKGALDDLREDQQNCAICLDQFQKENQIVELNCNEGHLFHFGCLEAWASRQQNCPLCRKDLIDEENVGSIILEIQGKEKPNEYALEDSQKVNLKQLELNPKNLKHLPSEERREILNAFNISIFEDSQILNDSISKMNAQEVDESMDNNASQNQSRYMNGLNSRLSVQNHNVAANGLPNLNIDQQIRNQNSINNHQQNSNGIHTRNQDRQQQQMQQQQKKYNQSFKRREINEQPNHEQQNRGTKEDKQKQNLKKKQKVSKHMSNQIQYEKEIFHVGQMEEQKDENDAEDQEVQIINKISNPQIKKKKTRTEKRQSDYDEEEKVPRQNRMLSKNQSKKMPSINQDQLISDSENSNLHQSYDRQIQEFEQALNDIKAKLKSKKDTSGKQYKNRQRNHNNLTNNNEKDNQIIKQQIKRDKEQKQQAKHEDKMDKQKDNTSNIFKNSSSIMNKNTYLQTANTNLNNNYQQSLSIQPTAADQQLQIQPINGYELMQTRIMSKKSTDPMSQNHFRSGGNYMMNTQFEILSINDSTSNNNLMLNQNIISSQYSGLKNDEDIKKRKQQKAQRKANNQSDLRNLEESILQEQLQSEKEEEQKQNKHRSKKEKLKNKYSIKIQDQDNNQQDEYDKDEDQSERSVNLDDTFKQFDLKQIKKQINQQELESDTDEQFEDDESPRTKQ
eukprot:403352797